MVLISKICYFFINYLTNIFMTHLVLKQFFFYFKAMDKIEELKNHVNYGVVKLASCLINECSSSGKCFVNTEYIVKDVSYDACLILIDLDGRVTKKFPYL